MRRPSRHEHPRRLHAQRNCLARRTGCADTVHTVSVTKGTCSYYDGCPSGGQLAICVLAGMTHCWAGGLADPNGDSCSGWASATQLEWEFFKTYAW